MLVKTIETIMTLLITVINDNGDIGHLYDDVNVNINNAKIRIIIMIIIMIIQILI